MHTMKRTRRTLLSGIGATAAGLAVGLRGAVDVRAQGKAPFVPARHEPDAWLDAMPGKHRVIIDVTSSTGATEGLAYANNLFTANMTGYGLPDEDVATVVCLRHLATVFAFNNTMWAKYGKALAESGEYTNPANPEPPTANPRRNIESLAKRGVHFAICSLATRRIAGQLATASGGKQDDILKELLANPVTNGHFMAAGVVATTRAQEYGFSLISCG
jgi:intracellular sulfur oxidation DsrE/DsrF family protein